MSLENTEITSSLSPIVEEVVQRILEVTQPQRSVLFGSSVRGKFTKDSDLDIFVVSDKPIHRRKVDQAIYRNLHGVRVPVDVLVVITEYVAQCRSQPSSILRHALDEGQVVDEQA